MDVEFIGMIHHRHAVGDPSAGADRAGSWLHQGLCPGGRGGRLRSRAGRLFFRRAGRVPGRRIRRRLHRAPGVPAGASAGFRGAHPGRAQAGDAGSDHRRAGGAARDLGRRRRRPAARRRLLCRRTSATRAPTNTCAILKRIWTEHGPIDHHGRYYRFEGASTAVRCVQRRISRSISVAPRTRRSRSPDKHADVYALWGETQAQVREITAPGARGGGAAWADGAVQPVAAPGAGGDGGCSVGARRTHQAADRRAARQGGAEGVRTCAGQRGLAPVAGGGGRGRAAGPAAVDRRGAR